MKLDLKTMEELAENMNTYQLDSIDLEVGGERFCLKKSISKEANVTNVVKTMENAETI